MIYYAITSQENFRVISDPSELVDGETLGNDAPIMIGGPTEFEAYCSMVGNGVTAWLSKYVHDSLGYDDIVSCASYAGDKNQKFNTEGTAARDWRSDCFIALYAAMPQYSVLTKDQWPTIEYITANLPQPSAYQWEPT